MYNWTNENDEFVLRIDRPQTPWPALLHEQLNALSVDVPSRIEWPTIDHMTPQETSDWSGTVIIRVAYDTDIADNDRSRVVTVIENHDGTSAIASYEEQKQRSEQILADNQALVDQARAKRLAGETLTTQELAAIADLFMFQGFQPQ